MFLLRLQGVAVGPAFKALPVAGRRERQTVEMGVYHIRIFDNLLQGRALYRLFAVVGHSLDNLLQLLRGKDPKRRKKAAYSLTPSLGMTCLAACEYPANVMDGAGAGGQHRIHAPLLCHQPGHTGGANHMDPLPVQRLIPHVRTALLVMDQGEHGVFYRE